MLTENLILQKSKQDTLAHIRKLNVTSSGLDNIDILRHCPNLEVCSLSVNNISELEPLSHCLNIEELYLRRNNISDVSQVNYLKPLRHLRHLWLSDNPCCSTRNYRHYVINALPQLVKLDDEPVHGGEETATKGIQSIPTTPVSASKGDTLDAKGKGKIPSQQQVVHEHTPLHFSRTASDLRNAYNGDDIPVGGGGGITSANRQRITKAVTPPQQDIPIQYGGKQGVPTPPTIAPSHHHHDAHHTSHPSALVHPMPRSNPIQVPGLAHRPKEEPILRSIHLLLGELSPVALQHLKKHLDERINNQTR